MSSTSVIRFYFRVSPMKRVMWFCKKGKLSPDFIGPYEIVECVGNGSYWLALPNYLDVVYDVFHIPRLKCYVAE